MQIPISPAQGAPVGTSRAAAVGLTVVLAAFAAFVVSSWRFDAGHPDFFYLADAFLHGRYWLDQSFGPWDSVVVGSRVYVPFAPFPAIAVMPIVALVGPVAADQWEQVIGSAFAAADMGLWWWLLGRLGVGSLRDRAWLIVLLGFSTPIWWVTTRGGVWHLGHLVATMAILGALIESWGRRRAWLLGLLVGAGFLSRAPVAFAAPFFAWILAVDDGASLIDPRRWPWRRWTAYGLGIAPLVGFAMWYNAVRFGSPLESGYALAALPAWLEQQRTLGLFSVQHLGMNLDFLFTHLPSFSTTPPFLRPDGLGLSIFLTSPGLLVALRADWRSKTIVALGLTALAVLVPSLLYYGGGWYQFGYRYALDSVPFVAVIVALAVARRGLPGWGRTLIAAGFMVNLIGTYWAYNP